MDAWTIRRAAEEFVVPKSTLYNRVSGHVPFEARSDPPRYLNHQEETQLVNFFNWLCQGWVREIMEGSAWKAKIDRWQKSISSKIDCLN